LAEIFGATDIASLLKAACCLSRYEDMIVVKRQSVVEDGGRRENPVILVAASRQFHRRSRSSGPVLTPNIENSYIPVLGSGVVNQRLKTKKMESGRHQR
jgi:hypothetical protein